MKMVRVPASVAMLAGNGSMCKFSSEDLDYIKRMIKYVHNAKTFKDIVKLAPRICEAVDGKKLYATGSVYISKNPDDNILSIDIALDKSKSMKSIEEVLKNEFNAKKVHSGVYIINKTICASIDGNIMSLIPEDWR